MRRQHRRFWADCLAGQGRAAETARPATRQSFSLPRVFCRVLGSGAILLSLVACSEDKQVVEEIRSVKTITIGDTTSGEVRKFSGIVRAVDRSALSFEVAGNVAVVNVDIGARVEKGVILAELDKEPYELEVKKAEAELVTAKAKLKKQLAAYKREQSIFDQGAGSDRRLEQTEFAFKEAESSVEFVTSKLNLAKRDLRKTVLYAPFNGSIGVREVDPFVDVRRGQKIFEIDGEGEQEIVVDIPETIVHRLTIGMPAAVAFSTMPGASTEGKVTEIGTVAGDGNAFPIKVRLIEPPSEVRSGMTVEATFDLQGPESASGYAIPVYAIAPTKESASGFVFVYQSDSSTVKQVAVKVGGIKDNMAIVSEGLAPGDIVAVAGVSFLSDAMKVKLMDEKQKPKPQPLVVE